MVSSILFFLSLWNRTIIRAILSAFKYVKIESPSCNRWGKNWSALWLPLKLLDIRQKWWFIILWVFRRSFLSADKAVGQQGFRAIWTEVSSEATQNCGSDFYCSHNSFCIDDTLRCNGIDNCGPDDTSDEDNCKWRFFNIYLLYITAYYNHNQWQKLIIFYHLYLLILYRSLYTFSILSLFHC